MDIELGIQNVARPVNFSTDESADNVSQAIAQAVADNATIDLTDDKGRRIIVPAQGTRLRDHRLRNQARRRLRQSLIATNKRVGHVPYGKRRRTISGSAPFSYSIHVSGSRLEIPYPDFMRHVSCRRDRSNPHPDAGFRVRCRRR